MGLFIEENDNDISEARFPDMAITRDLEGFKFDGLPTAFASNNAFATNTRDIVETGYHDLVRINFFLQEAEIHEEFHEHANFLDELRQLRGKLMGVLCSFKVLDQLNGYNISPEVTSSVVPPEVSNLIRKKSMRQRDYVVLHHLEKYLHQLEKDLYNVSER